MNNSRTEDFRGAKIIAQGMCDDDSGLRRIAYCLRDGQLVVRDYRYEIEPAALAA